MRNSTLVRLAPLVSAVTLCLFLGYAVLDNKVRAQGAAPASVMELIRSLKMTEKQEAAFEEQETLRKESQARLQQLKGEERRAAAEAFQAKRKAALQELFNEEQWKLWDDYWTAHFSRPSNQPQPQGNPGPPQPVIPLDAPDFAEATGRFQLAKRNGRVSLIAPDGKPFFSLGVTHIVAIGAPTGGEPNVMADRFGGDWTAMAAKTNENLRAWGYNSTGYGTPRPLGKLIPFAEGIHTADTSMYFGNKQFSYPDVFDPAWKEKVKETLRKKIEPLKDNPNLMGVYWTDMPLWDLKYGQRSGKTNWVEAMKALPEEAPGRQRYETFLAEQGDKAIDEEFLRLIARNYYKVLGEETRRLAPDSIIFGERYGPNITPSFVIEEAAPWIDAVAVQPYGNTFNVRDFDRIHRASGGKGILICDHNISFPTKEHPKTMWTQLPTPEEVAQTHAKYVNDALSKPYILGYHRCQYIDRFQSHLGVLKQGVLKADGNPYEELVELLTKTNKEVLERFANWEGQENSATAVNPKEVPDLLGKKGFVHVECQDGIWFMVNADGERFIPTGMNHIGPMHRFAPYNKDHWIEKFGPETLTNQGQPDWQGPGVKRWMEQIARDHLDNGFNTLAFHHPLTMPTEYCNELGLYYFGKLKMSHVNPKRAPRMSPDGKYPDVFSQAWIRKLDGYVEKYTAKHKDSKYLLGYSFEDLPAYTVHHLEKRITKFEHHPWIIDIISKPGVTLGKRAWIDVLKQQYPTAAEAGAMYGLEIADWVDFHEVSDWPLPNDAEQGFADQALMNAKIVEAYLKAHHDAIRKHDPNHLIFGDKIQNQRPQPDWVWEIVRKYVDVILIQDYDFFTPAHEKKLRHIYHLTGKPIINGDHSYGMLRPNMTAVKGVKVNSAKEKGQQYATYLRGILNLPFMLGWQTCGYLETWEGTTDATGKQQTGYFDPFGEPIEEALSLARDANAQALAWHEKAGTLENVYSTRNLLRAGMAPSPNAEKASKIAVSDGPIFSEFSDIKAKATGFIHVKEIDGKWWFIDANGYAFFPVGITHSQPFPGIVKQFPSTDAYYDAALKNMKALGFNSLSVLSGPAQITAQRNRIAYTHTINLGIPHGSTYQKPDFFRVDPFTPEFEATVEANVKKACAMRKDDPFLLGYSYGFNPFQIPHKWINHLLSQGATSPGKVALVDVYEELYAGDIASFNGAYGKNFSGFDDILACTDIAYEEALNPWPGETLDRPLKRDFDQLVYAVVAKVHEVAHRHVRKHDSNHLILGFYFKTYNANLGLYEAIAPYVDVLSPQHHVVAEYHQDDSFNYEAGIINAAEISRRTGKPIYHGDQWLGKVVPSPTGQKLRGNKSRYPYFSSQEHRGQVYEGLMESVLASPKIVGFAACATFYDNPDIGGSHGGNKGLADSRLKDKTDFTSHVEKTNAQLYERRTRAYKPEEVEALNKKAAETLMRAASELVGD